MGLFDEVVELFDTDRLDEPIEAYLENDDRLRHFWEFANETRRTASLGATASNFLRGLWLTSELAVQRIDGWGPQVVRILCVTAGSPTRKERLQRFFRADRQNMEAHLGMVQDPLEQEPRVLVKIPYNVSLQEPVLQEQKSLRKLQGCPGVPILYRPIWFKDAKLIATTFRYNTATNLQKQLEVGHRLPLEHCHQLWQFLLRTLQYAHKMGIVHGNLQPKDVLIDFGSSCPTDAAEEKEAPSSNPSRADTPPTMSEGGSSSARDTPDGDLTQSAGGVEVHAMICDWTASRDIRKDVGTKVAKNGKGGGPNLMQLLDQLCGDPSVPGSIGAETAGSYHAYSLSLYSAPEQYLEAYVGQFLSGETTDLYRVAAIIAMAFAQRNPLSTTRVARLTELIRRMCHDSIVRQEAETVSFPEEEQQAFRQCLQRLIDAPTDMDWVAEAPELRDLFEKCLQKEPDKRPKSSSEALAILDSAWSAAQERLRIERESRSDPLALSSAAKTGAEEGGSPARRKRLVLEPPPELEHMHVL
mmetsp:Transcript_9936/g.21854  ORF Transcript_9936/g.21854 Transcript_9936/m.21854 type:complete len:528 (+) Transcript_9936:155-1738(+)|eukprot:CAMPEP_0206427214 /NCGR_PEP_ID=MMETSP0324_2-20121206/4892_1 /ASSEMBLY_ACC=CAM_ASM_000836 /TAXON_ID=2866 /ORGANISM="Crypthecodinium cohnii, Strain Seligo" /LENGTH=527 /DNA_ID=CAMNT_0053892421 /DNA_START=94 /DNA_END=1677 /DNA_ORIENTATION=+